MVIPIIVCAVNWKNASFSHLQALPKDGKAVNLWPDKDSAWCNVSKGIEREIQEISAGGNHGNETPLFPPFRPFRSQRTMLLPGVGSGRRLRPGKRSPPASADNALCLALTRQRKTQLLTRRRTLC